MKFVNGIWFEVKFGQPHKSKELRSVFQNIFNGTYKTMGSSIEISRNNKIIMNLTLQMPKQEVELDPNVVVGVDLGVAIPAYCALNTNDYVKKACGNADDFLRVSTQIKAERRRLQKSLKYNSGGHGRKKKLAPMDRFTDYESNWAKTYNHKISNDIVDFAVKNHAKYINIENLQGFGSVESADEVRAEREPKSKNFLLGNWRYYQLQQFITYKAEKYNIEVRKVNPYYTSRRCSCCGNEDANNRKSQAEFVCTKCGAKMNADFNVARNIAMSTDFSDGKTSKETKKRQHKEYIAKNQKAIA